MTEFTTVEGDSLLIYLNEIRKIPRLTMEEEVALVALIAAGRAAADQLQREPHADPAVRAALQAQIDDAQKARERLVQANLRLVVFVARRYDTPGLTGLDLIQEGNIGLMRAVETFDPQAGRFSTYAAWWIRQRITRSLEEQGRLIRLPTGVWTAKRAAQRADARLWQMFQREPTAEEIAVEVGHPLDWVRAALSTPDTCSFSTQMNRADADEDVRTLESMVADDQALAPEAAVEQRALRAALRQALASLNERERQIIVWFYGLDGDHGDRRTFEEIGAQLGISRARAYQLGKRALATLRRAAVRLGLGAFLGLPTSDTRSCDQAPPPEEGEVRIRRLTPGVTRGKMCKFCTSSPKLPTRLPPGLPRTFPAVFTALAGAPSMEVAALRSGYSYSQFHRILTDARQVLGLPDRQRRHATPTQLAQELAKALRRPGQSRARAA